MCRWTTRKKLMRWKEANVQKEAREAGLEEGGGGGGKGEDDKEAERKKMRKRWQIGRRKRKRRKRSGQGRVEGIERVYCATVIPSRASPPP